MQEAFGVVLIAVVVIGGIAAVLTFALSRSSYEEIGKGGFFTDQDAAGRQPRIAPARAAAEQEEEIRQLLEARNVRRAARGEAPLDIDDEYRRLMAPAADPALEQEIREHVRARNARRVARGKPPLDEDAEVARQLAELGGGGA